MDINDLTYQINGAIFEVNRELGGGFLEKVYENALLVELRERGLKAESRRPIRIKYKGREVGEYYADILVEDKVILELKTVESIERIHEAQLLHYLKATGYKFRFAGQLQASQSANKETYPLNPFPLPMSAEGKVCVRPVELRWSCFAARHGGWVKPPQTNDR